MTEIIITAKHINRERNHSTAANSPDEFSGTIDGKAWRVVIHPTAAPDWYDSDLTDDEQVEVLNEIERNDNA